MTCSASGAHTHEYSRQCRQHKSDQETVAYAGDADLHVLVPRPPRKLALSVQLRKLGLIVCICMPRIPVIIEERRRRRCAPLNTLT